MKLLHPWIVIFTHCFVFGHVDRAFSTCPAFFGLVWTNDNPKELGIKNFNIMLIGSTGAGKSTLINALLRKDEAAIDHVSPCTQDFNEYKIPNSDIKLIDSKGFEQKDFVDIKNNIITEIKRRSSSDPSNIIHMVWYCVKSQGHRLVKAEHIIIEELRTIRIPIIIIVTNSWNGEEKLNEAIKRDSENKYILYNEFQEAQCKEEIVEKNIIIINVLAKKFEYTQNMRKQCVAPFGIPSLIDLISFFLPEEKKYMATQMKLVLNHGLSDIVKAINQSKVKMINILTVGNSGSGKSELIKRIFDLDIETNVGMSVTQKITQYMVKNKPLSIYDTVGFEYGRCEEIKEEIIQLIKDKSKDFNPSKHIHIVWYVINEGMKRIQQNDIDVIETIRKLKIPIIIILNNSQLDNKDIMKGLMNGEIIKGVYVPDINLISKSPVIDRKELIDLNIAVMCTNAKNTYDNKGRLAIPAFGANNLISLTRLYINNAEKNAFQTSVASFKFKKKLIGRKIYKYEGEVEQKWIFSLEYRETIFDNALRKMITEMKDIYNVNWGTYSVLEIINHLYEEEEWFQYITDKLYGGLKFFGAFPTKECAIKFINECGKIINDTFYSLFDRGDKNLHDITTEKFNSMIKFTAKDHIDNINALLYYLN